MDYIVVQYGELGGFIGCRSDKLYKNTNVSKITNILSPIIFYCGGKDYWDKNDNENDTIKKCQKNYSQFLKRQNPRLNTSLVIISDANHNQMGKIEYNCIKNYFEI